MENEKTIERDRYAYVVAMSPEAARRFFGQPETVEVIDDGPPHDPTRYRKGARTFGVAIPS